MIISKEVKTLSEFCEVKELGSTKKIHLFQVKNAVGKLHEVDIHINCSCTNCVEWAGMGKICSTSLAAISYIANFVNDSNQYSNRLKQMGSRDQQIVELALGNLRDAGLIAQRDVVDLTRRVWVAMKKKEDKNETLYPLK